MGIDPVERASWTDLKSVIEAVSKADSRGGQIIPTPSRQNFPKSAVLTCSGLKTESEFERKFDMASIDRSKAGIYSVDRYQKSPTGSGRVVDPSMSTTYAPGTTIEKVIEDLHRSILLK